MNRRLRKKLHRGEYAVRGFHLEFTTRERLPWRGPTGKFDGPGDAFSESLDAWAHERGWCAAPGGDGRRWGCFVVPEPERENKPHPGLTEQDRSAILAHVQSLPEVEQVVAGPLVDAYDYGADEVAWLAFCREADQALGAR